MKKYIYNGINPFYNNDSNIAESGDTLIIGENSIVNQDTGHEYYNLSETVITNIVADCEYIEEFEPEKILTDEDRFEAITKHMLEIFKKKNHDYGNSFEQSLNEEGLAGMRIRGGDKWLRFKNLSKGVNPLVKDESIRDTLMDLSNYCIMTIMWMDKNQRDVK